MSRRKPAVWARARTSPGIDPEIGEGSVNWELEKIQNWTFKRAQKHGDLFDTPLEKRQPETDL